MTAPANDNFADAIVLSGSLPITRTGDSNVDATTEGSEPITISYGEIDPGDETVNLGHSVWYSWTPASSGSYRIRIDGDFDSVIGVYTGASLGSLTRVEQSETNYDSPYFEQIYLDATASTTYYIQVGGWSTESGTFDIEVDSSTPPANDDFADAEIITGTTASGDNTGAGLQSGEPRGDDGGYYIAVKTVWFKWNSGAGGEATVTLSPTFSSWSLAVFTGSSVGSLTTIAAHSWDGPVTFTASPSTDYYIQVGGNPWGGLNEGTFDLDITLPPVPPDNDNFADRTVLSGSLPITRNGDTLVDATMEDGEPTYELIFSSVWYEWTATVDTEVTFSCLGDGFSAIAVVAHTGTTLEDIELVAAGTYPGDGYEVSLTFTPTIGTTYLIQVGAASGQQGVFDITLFDPNLIEGDAFVDAIPLTLSGGSASASATTTGTSIETGEPVTFAGWGGTVTSSVWFSFQPDEDGVVRFDTFGSGFDTTAAAFTGGAVNSLSVLAFNDDYLGGSVTIPQSQISWAAQGSTTYYMQVGGWDNEGTASVHLYFEPYPAPVYPDAPPELTPADNYRVELRSLSTSGFSQTTASLDLVTFSCNWRLNAPGAFEGTGVLGTIQTDAANVGARELIVYKGATAIWGGYLTFFDADEDSKRVRISAEGYWSRARSLVMKGNQIYKPLTNNGVSWKADVIAWDIIDQAQGASYGDVGWSFGGHSGTRYDCKRIYYAVDRTNVASAIETLAREDYFDFSVDVRNTPTAGDVAKFRTWAKRGTDRSATIDLNGTNAVTLNYSLSSSDLYTYIDVFGSVEGCRGVAATDSANLSTYGRLEGRAIDMETDEQGEVDRAASDFIDQHSVPAKNATVSYMEGVGPDLTSYDIGDTIKVSPADGYVSYFTGRVISRELAVEARRAVITVEVER